MPASNRYEIRLYDRTLVEFAIESDGFSDEAKLLDWDDTAQELMPCGLSPSGEGIWRWLELRSIPANRRNAAVICRALGFSLGDVEALYRTSLGLSLNDSYWVVPQNFRGKFDNYNLFENEFSEAIGALAVAGEVRSSMLAGNTPELTTDGSLRKGWRISEGRRVLYKGASEGFVPGEPLSEYLASLVARTLGLNAVSYGIDTWEGETCSTCENFATKDVSYVPFAVATGKADMASALWVCACLGDESFESFCDMLAFDALTCNTDRHLTNFGLLRDNKTGTALGLAPIFDNGRSLFPNVAENNSTQFTLEAQLCSPAFGATSFEGQLERIMGERQVALMELAASRGIVGNTLAPRERVSALDSFLRRRAEELSRVPLVDRDELMHGLSRAMEKRGSSEDRAFRIGFASS